MAAKLQVEGFKEITKALSVLEVNIQKKVLRSAMRKNLKPLLAESKKNAPKVSGDLRKSLRLKAGKRKKHKFSINVMVGKKNFVGKTFYGAMVELGTKKMKARHFMKAAFDAKGPAARDAMMKDIKDQIIVQLKKSKRK